MSRFRTSHLNTRAAFAARVEARSPRSRAEVPYDGDEGGTP